MSRDQVLSNRLANGEANPAFLNELQAMAVETPEPLALAEQLLEEARFARVMRMTAQRFVLLSPAEKRNHLRWADHFAQIFNEKAALFRRNTPADIELPEFLRQKHG